MNTRQRKWGPFTYVPQSFGWDWFERWISYAPGVIDNVIGLLTAGHISSGLRLAVMRWQIKRQFERFKRGNH